MEMFDGGYSGSARDTMTSEDVGMPTTTPAAPSPSALAPTLQHTIEGTNLIPVSSFSAQQVAQVEKIAKSITLDNSLSTDFFMAQPLKSLNTSLDRTLSGVRVDDMGEKGSAIILSIRKDFDSLKLDKVKTEILKGRSVLASLPFIGKYFSAFKKMRALHQPVLDHLEKTRTEGEIILGQLKQVISTSDQQYQATEKAVEDFSLWIAGGQQAWLRMRDEYRLQAEAIGDTPDPAAIARLRDRAEALDSFAANMVELRIAHLGFIASLPTIRMTQKAARIEVQNTLRAIFLDMPRIKMAMRTMASLNQIQKGSKNARVQKKMAQDLARLTADMTAQAYTSALESEGDFASGVETIDYIINSVTGTIDKGLEIREQNILKRDEAVRNVDAAYERLLGSLRNSATQGLIR